MTSFHYVSDTFPRKEFIVPINQVENINMLNKIDDKSDIINNVNYQHDKELSEKNAIHLLSSTSRSGSSFISAIIHSFPTTFYLFEPLRSLARKTENFGVDSANKMLNEIFNCNLSKFHLNILSLEYNPVFCYKDPCYRQKNCPNITQLNDYCKKFNSTLVKTIRSRLSWRESFLSSSDNAKLIHLIRDPRGFITSQMELKILKKRNVTLACNNVLQDINTSYDFKKKYAKR